MTDQTTLLHAPPRPSTDPEGWHEIHVGPDRIRWRHDGLEHAHYGAGYEVEVWSRSEWRAVRNWSSRDWFCLGLLAGMEGA